MKHNKTNQKEIYFFGAFCVLVLAVPLIRVYFLCFKLFIIISSILATIMLILFRYINRDKYTKGHVINIGLYAENNNLINSDYKKVIFDDIIDTTDKYIEGDSQTDYSVSVSYMIAKKGKRFYFLKTTFYHENDNDYIITKKIKFKEFINNVYIGVLK